jgi:hypothetical protein
METAAMRTTVAVPALGGTMAMFLHRTREIHREKAANESLAGSPLPPGSNVGWWRDEYRCFFGARHRG